MTDGSSFLRHICSWWHRTNLLNDMVLIDNIQRLNYAHNYSYRVKSFPDKRRLDHYCKLAFFVFLLKCKRKLGTRTHLQDPWRHEDADTWELVHVIQHSRLIRRVLRTFCYNSSLICRCHHYLWKVAYYNLLCSALIAIENEGFFNMPHLQWPGTYVFKVVSEDPWHLWANAWRLQF